MWDCGTLWKLALIALLVCACNSKEEPNRIETKQEEPAPKTEEPPAEAPPAEPKPQTLEEAAAELEIPLDDIEEPETFRSAKKAPACQVLYPRATVRLTDLDNYRVDVSPDFEPAGNIEFRIGKKVLSSVEFDPGRFVNVRPVPDEVVEALKEGQEVTWGYYPKKGKPVTTKFKVAKKSARLARKLARIETKRQPGTEVIVGELRSQALLNARLYYAAYKEASKVTKIMGEGAHQSYAVMQKSLRGMKLKNTAMWAELTGNVKQLSRFYNGRLPHRTLNRRTGLRGG